MRTTLGRCFLIAAMTIAGATGSIAQEGPAGDGAAFARGPMVRGTVTATAADHLTIKTESSEVYQIALTPNTRLMKDRQPVQAADIKVGDGVGAMGELDAPKKTMHALFVAVVDAEQVKKMREDLGKTYITGKVTAIDEVKLTILRPDHVSQVIEVDETTSFRRGRGRRREAGSPDGGATGGNMTPGVVDGSGEIVTLADFKVGDMIAGRGSVKHGVFVPTNLALLPPGAEGAMGMRARRGSNDAPSTGAPAPSSTKQ
jgi:hypothetical protein